MSPRDAAVFDPQHRLFAECAWETTLLRRLRDTLDSIVEVLPLAGDPGARDAEAPELRPTNETSLL